MVEIEYATGAELEFVVESWVALAVEQREHNSHLLPEANREHLREDIAHAVVNDGVFVARVEGELVGFVMFGLASSRLERDVTRGMVYNAWVAPDRRGAGVGSALFDAAERELADRGADRIALEVMAANRAARRLYRRRGYEPHRVMVEKSAEDESDTHTN